MNGHTVNVQCGEDELMSLRCLSNEGRYAGEPMNGSRTAVVRGVLWGPHTK